MGQTQTRKTPASVRAYALQLFQSPPSKWSPAQKKLFTEHCDKSRMLDATSCGLPCEEIIKMLQVLQSHIDERRRATHERQRSRKGKKQYRSSVSFSSSSSTPSSSSSSPPSRLSTLVDPNGELEESDLRVLFMGRLFENSAHNNSNSNNNTLASITTTSEDKKQEKREEQFLSLFLTHLNLSKNSISYFPREICRPVDGLGSRLTHLNLSHNNIEYLPPSIHLLRFLETFDLSFNKLIAVPKEIGELSALTFLGLEGNCVRYLPFQILSLGRSTLSITVENNPWLQPGQLHNINECLRDRGLFPAPSSSASIPNHSNNHNTLPGTPNDLVGVNQRDEEQQETQFFVDNRSMQRHTPSLIHMCVKAIEKYDICWEVYAECIPVDIQSMLIAGARVCDKCHRPLDATLRPQIALIHFQKSAFGSPQPLPFLYSICSRECSRFILIASCILEVFFLTPSSF
eukprot:TRINITY_DN4851_c0_g1_i2.p1 TRINITY_DN4851_c0_g1~~TRINITY_DN4851_c0_g1_i2.p1  ORF type:complete len:459 (+),score=65.21 TRINITY_DN4851_c0_g1_i2:322-1698(+)